MRLLAAACIAVVLAVMWLWFDGTRASAPTPAATAPAALPVAPEVAPSAASRSLANEPAAAPTPPTAPVPTSSPTTSGRLQVYARSERGDPMPGCRVFAADREQTTDQAGGARFELAPGRVFVAVEPPPDSNLVRCSGHQTVEADRECAVVVVLVARATTPFWCRLVAAEDDRPLPGVDGQSRPDGSRWCSDADGYVHVTAPDERTWLTVQAPGRSPRHIVPATGHETRATALRVPLATACTLHLQVVDAAGGAVPDVQFELTAPAWELQWPESMRARSEPQRWQAVSNLVGAATITGLPRNARVAVHARPGASFAQPEPTWWVFRATDEQRTLALPAAGSVHGVVVDAAGLPVADIQVQANELTTTPLPRVLDQAAETRCTKTTADGSFALTGLAAGRWWIGTDYDGVHRPTVTAIDVVIGQSTQVTLQVAAGKPVAGCALAPDGRPCAGVTITAQLDDQTVASRVTDAEGRFRFAALPDGPCELTLDPFDGDLALAEPVVVDAGNETVELHLRALRGTVTGHTDASAWVTAYQRDGGNVIGARCDLDGTFTYRGLDAGIWDLSALDPQGRVAWCADVQVVPGRVTGPLELTLQPSALLRPRHIDADEFIVCRGNLVVASDSLVQGASGEAHVLPGEWTVVFRRGGKEIARQHLKVAAGEDRFVDGG